MLQVPRKAESDSGSTTAASSGEVTPQERTRKEDVALSPPCHQKMRKSMRLKDLAWRFACVITTTSAMFSDGVVAHVNCNEDLLCKKVMQSVRMMQSCGYHATDIAWTLAFASVYFKRLFAIVGAKIQDFEAVHICTMLIYLAHVHVLDETCPLHVWQRYIFKTYSSVKTLNAAIVHTLRMPGFRLFLEEDEAEEALDTILGRTGGRCGHGY
eukprot:TRINITY_DN33167_c0_g1_i1.p1 TRINITY_DN33167_c0_g1~~TRINITY_DN33167_c0_g1_i1.p1  ORF type:complete len:212 (+),score=44.67 TRINITY_DN33167_c0_g1_i1:127-762(+)